MTNEPPLRRWLAPGEARRLLGLEPTLEADLAAVLRREPFGLALGELALVVGRRRQVVLDALRADERFARVGAGAGTRWRLAPHPWEQAGTPPGGLRDAQHVRAGKTHARPPAA